MTPYADLPEYCFWKAGVARANPRTIQDLYRRKFEIRARDRIATAGSCFAQHITGQLKTKGYRVIDAEPAPPWLDAPTRRANGYDLFSARYGNIYTARQLLQLAQEAFGDFEPPETVWTRKNRFYDAFRPGVDPRGVDSADEVLALRADHLIHVREMLTRMKVFIFTLGLTEAWMDAKGTTVFPTAPGTVAGQWDPARYRFVNFTSAEVLADLRAFRALVETHNRRFRMILTVSPVPLTATATDQHVLQANTYSKSALRVAATEMAATDDLVDYFPSYDLISAPAWGGVFFEPDRRTVSADGIAAAMSVFFDQHPPVGEAVEAAPLPPEDVHCEEQMQEAFGT